ncbi:MAG: S8 family peptidase [Caldilineaceae bacterium]
MIHYLLFLRKGQWRYLVTSLALLCLTLAGSIPIPIHAAASSSAKIQPLLRQFAITHPEQLVGVIVQKANASQELEAMVIQLGGKITHELNFIHAFSAELPAKAISTLAQSNQVRWISLDAPVNQSQVSTPTVFTTWATKLGTANGWSTLSANFGSTPIPTDSYIWFNSSFTVSGLGSLPAMVYVDNASVQFTANGIPYNLTVPDAAIIFSPWTTTATTTFEPAANRWITLAPINSPDTIFLTALAFPVTAALPGGIANVTWQAQFQSDIAGLSINWNWGAAVYGKAFSTDYTTLGVKPISSATASQYKNNDPAGTPENARVLVNLGACGDGSNYTASCVAPVTIPAYTSFAAPTNIFDAGLGPNNTYGFGSKAKESFGGFNAEVTPGHVISKVEIVLQGYALMTLRDTDNALLTLLVGGQKTAPVTLDHSLFNTHLGSNNAGPIYVDVTNLRTWKWGDFDQGIEVDIDQSMFQLFSIVGYDAVGLRVTSIPGTDTTGGLAPVSLPKLAIDTNKLVNVYSRVVHARKVWNEGPAYLQGQGVTVAVVDSGIVKTRDLDDRLIGKVNFNSAYHNAADRFGHGTFVAHIIAGSGLDSGGKYIGIAPKANLLNVRISDDQGISTESDLINALQWIYNNKAQFNIRVVNLSLNSTIQQSYNTSPVDAACELLWFNGIVVVTSAGNNGSAALYPPANDPFVITVGAIDDNGTVALDDDTLATFSAYGQTESGGVKPDLVAPGRNLIAMLPENKNLTMGINHPDNWVATNYFRMSGTSVAAPIVSGAVALLLQDEPTLNPDQVKFRLMKTANKSWLGYDPVRAGAGALDIYAAVTGSSTRTANTGVAVSNLLTTGTSGVLSLSVNWSSVNWSSVNWSSVNWSSVNWSSVNWSSVNWSSDYWETSVIAASAGTAPPSEADDLGPADTTVTQPNRVFIPLIATEH